MQVHLFEWNTATSRYVSVCIKKEQLCDCYISAAIRGKQDRPGSLSCVFAEISDPAATHVS